MPSGSLIRGGQVTLHSWRMATQLVRILAFIAMMTVVLTAIITMVIYYKNSPRFVEAAFYHYRAITIGAFQDDDKTFAYTDQNGRVINIPVGRLRTDPAFIQSARRLEKVAIDGAILGAKISGSIVLIVIIGFWARGRAVMKTRRIKGATLVTARKLRKLVNSNSPKKISRYSFAGIPWRKDAETLHTLIVGSTGTGKTVAISDLLDQIRKNGDKAIVYDKLGSFVPYYYREHQDVILNPLDARTADWCIFTEAESEIDFHTMAAALIPDFKDMADPFWFGAARQLFAQGAASFWKKNDYDLQALLKLLINADLKELAASMKNTGMQSIINEDVSKTALSVRSVLTQQAQALAMLPEVREPFSIREWVQDTDESGFLFLNSDASSHEVRRAMIATQIELAIVAKLSTSKRNPQRLWLVLDELPTLGKIPSLASGLRESRQFGMSIVLGTQVFSELKDLYGREAAITISGNCNTRFILSSPDRDTANWASDNLGRIVTERVSEGFSYGASEIRDGVTQNRREDIQPIVLPSDIMTLPPLRGFLKMPQDLPVAEIRLRYKQRKMIAEANIKQQPPAIYDEITDEIFGGNSAERKATEPKAPKKKSAKRKKADANATSSNDTGQMLGEGPSGPPLQAPENNTRTTDNNWPHQAHSGPVSLGEASPDSTYEKKVTTLDGENKNQMNLALNDETASTPTGQRTSPQEVKPQQEEESQSQQEAKPQQEEERQSQQEAKPHQGVKPKTSATTGNAVAAPAQSTNQTKGKTLAAKIESHQQAFDAQRPLPESTTKKKSVKASDGNLLNEISDTF